jgi:MFS transporter, PPP family, 3-phenylpropionic acid transporter
VRRPFLPDDSATRIEAACQYVLYFGVMGMHLPYFNLYCYHLGFSGVQIGSLSALRSLAMVVFPIAWGALADRTRGRRPIYILCTCASAATWSMFLAAETFPVMAAITAVYGMFYAPIISFLEAIAMEVLGAAKQRYGRIRLWGSISFIAVVLLFGPVIERFSVRVIIPSILAGSLLLAAMSVTVPRDRPAGRRLQLSSAGALLRPRPLLFLLCGFLMLASHGAYYGFFSIHLEQLGCSTAFIGGAWALASGAEIIAMLGSAAIFERVPLERVLLASTGAATLRWAVLGWTGSPAVILASQVLHALTYGAFHMASILYMDRLSPADGKNLGQAMNNALTYGLGLMTGFLVSGYVYARAGSFAAFQLCGLLALSGGILWAAACARARTAKAVISPAAGPKRSG